MIITFQKSRIFRVFVVCIVGYALYSYYLSVNYTESEVTLSNFKNETSKRMPQKVTRLGNFEPTGETETKFDADEKDIPQCTFRNESGQTIAEQGVNMVCSDEISLDRNIPDTRLEECKHWDYPEDMPKASVIIVFHNEGWSTLMRTVHSVINRTPPLLLEEILLVDDHSYREYLQDNLKRYIVRFDGKVKLIRNNQREGLIRSKTRGAREALGKVIVFLDAHCEVNINWLPPLLAPIYRDRTVMTVPIIDVIDLNNFGYHPEYPLGDYRGSFEWGMIYGKRKLTLEQIRTRKYDSEPYKSPTHAGGLLAIDREFFLFLGAYDPGLLIWGGENMELSFKIWQCGGSIEWIPCSRVGHVYRKFMPYDFATILARGRKGPPIIINYKRVVETWFDPKHKEYFYTREPLARFLDHGDISGQLAVKKRLKCKSFQWYMENVAYDLIPDLPRNIHWGELRNMGSKMCMDTIRFGISSLMRMMPCHGYGLYQLIRLNAKGQLGVGETCIDGDADGVKLVPCPVKIANGPWSYNETTLMLFHRRQRKCVVVQPPTFHLALRPCRVMNNYHKWNFQTLRPWGDINF